MQVRIAQAVSVPGQSSSVTQPLAPPVELDVVALAPPPLLEDEVSLPAVPPAPPLLDDTTDEAPPVPLPEDDAADGAPPVPLLDEEDAVVAAPPVPAPPLPAPPLLLPDDEDDVVDDSPPVPAPLLLPDDEDDAVAPAPALDDDDVVEALPGPSSPQPVVPMQQRNVSNNPMS